MKSSWYVVSCHVHEDQLHHQFVAFPVPALVAVLYDRHKLVDQRNQG